MGGATPHAGTWWGPINQHRAQGLCLGSPDHHAARIHFLISDTHVGPHARFCMHRIAHLDVDEEGCHGDGGDDESGEGHEDGGGPLGGHKGVALCGAGQGGHQVGGLGLREQEDASGRVSGVCASRRGGFLCCWRDSRNRGANPLSLIGFGFGGQSMRSPAPSQPKPYGPLSALWNLSRELRTSRGKCGPIRGL